MTKFASAVPALALSLIAAGGLAGCSQKTQDSVANTADGAATDVSATTRNAVNSVGAATDRAMDKAQNSIDQASPTFNHAVEGVGNAADRAKEKAGRAMKDAGNAIER